MPRKPRLFLPNTPQHLVVRGHNRSSIFVRVEDFRFMYKCILEASQANNLAIHAWVFMRNHLHILATPEHQDSTAKTMQSIGRKYAQYFNRCCGRSGSLWEDRYKSGLVDTERYLLCCYRYIELNPVRAGIVQSPEDYPYSSYQYNALGKPDRLVTPHEYFLALEPKSKAAPTSREQIQRSAYRALFDEELSHDDLAEIRRGANKNTPIGNSEFLQRVASKGVNKRVATRGSESILTPTPSKEEARSFRV